MIKFYNVPLLTAGGFAFDFTAPKQKFEDEFHLLVKTGLSYEPIANFIFQIFHQHNWKRVMLAYRKNDHVEWSGSNSCQMLMSTIVKKARENNITFDEIKLDSTDKLFGNDSQRMLKESMRDYAAHAAAHEAKQKQLQSADEAQQAIRAAVRQSLTTRSPGGSLPKI